MSRRSKPKSNQNLEKILAVSSILILILAWWLGSTQLSQQKISMLNGLVSNNETLSNVEGGLYRVSQQGEQTAWLSIGEGIGYGGAMSVAIKTDLLGNVIQTSILSIKDTSSYVEKVIESGLFETILGQSSKSAISVDAISGATLTSKGLLDGTNFALDPIRQQIWQYQIAEPNNPLDNVGLMDVAALLLFILSVMISRSSSEYKVKMQWALMLSAMVILGFYSASLISSSTIAILVSGSWTGGLGNYTALLLLILTAGYLLVSGKNVYCQMICPMGTTQQCLSKLANAKTLTLKGQLFVWLPRVILLVVLAGNLYFHNPASFTYEPFGIMFGMVGSIYLFAATITIVITSLFVHRPWCKTLCPINALTDYLLFCRSWVKQIKKSKAKRQSKAHRNGKEKPIRNKRDKQASTVIIKEEQA